MSLLTSPGDWASRRELVEKVFGKSEFESAAALLESAPTLPEDGEAVLFCAEVFLKTNPFKAHSLISGLLENEPGNTDAHIALARVYMAQAIEGDARRHFEKAAGNAPSLREAGFDAVMLGEFPAAESDGSEPTPEPEAEAEVPGPAAPSSPEHTALSRQSSPVLVNALRPPGEDAEPDPVPAIGAPATAGRAMNVPRAQSHAVSLPPVNTQGVVVPPASASTASVALPPPPMTGAFEMSGGDAGGAGVAHDPAHPFGDPHLAEEAREAMDRKNKAASLVVGVMVHAVLLLLFGIIVIFSAGTAPPEIVTFIGDPNAPRTLEKKQVQQNVRMQPSTPTSAETRMITSTAPSSVFLPVIEKYVESDAVGLGGIGAGAGLGLSGGGGGPVSFFGNNTKGRRILYVVDTSASLSAEQLALTKSELTKSLQALPANIHYQVLFFSGPVWFAHQELVTRRTQGSKEIIVKDGNRKILWEQKHGGAGGFRPKGGGYPVSDWIVSNRSNIRKTIKDVERQVKTYGTSWEVPITNALHMQPKPDVIYFMTDGRVSGAAQQVETITALNRRKAGGRAKIFTTSMMEPAAGEELWNLANKNGGKFSLVSADGKSTVYNNPKDIPGKGAKKKKKKKKK